MKAENLEHEDEPRARDTIVGETRRMIREIKDPVELQRQLQEMLEEEYPAVPVPIFQEGEVLPFHEFEARFKKAVCGGNLTRLAQWKVQVFEGPHGELAIGLGTSAKGKVESKK